MGSGIFPFSEGSLFSLSVPLTTLLTEVSDRKTMNVLRSVTHIANCIIDSVNRYKVERILPFLGLFSMFVDGFKMYKQHNFK